MVEDLEDLAMKEEFLGVYDNEKEQRILQNTYYEEGIEEGTEKGEKKKQLEIAINMLNDELDVNLVSKYTGLSVDDIKSIELPKRDL